MTENSGSYVSIREFLVDLLGCLVPGFIFLFLATMSLVWPSWSIVREVQKALPLSLDFLNSVKDFASAFRFEVIGFFLVSSYVLGHFLYRQDPKVPDQFSYQKATGLFSNEEKSHWVVRQKCGSLTDIQFPYLYLHEYLTSRNLKHLAEMIPWKGADKETHNRRTKAFINIMKIRLLFFFPEKCGPITRNEAHIRLMSSVWYAGKALRMVGWIAIGIGIVASIVGIWNPQDWEFARYMIPILPSVAIILVSVWAMKTIEKFLHYQRVREIIFVLETAYNARQERNDLLEGLLGEGDEPAR